MYTTRIIGDHDTVKHKNEVVQTLRNASKGVGGSKV